MISRVSAVGIGALAAAMLVLPGAAFAQSTDQDIVVTGAKPPAPEEVRRYVANIVDRVDGQLARFHEPVCPDLVGLPDDYTQKVLTRFRTVAARAGVEVAKPGCGVNILIVIAPDGRKFAQGLRQAAPRVFQGLEPAEIRALLKKEGPVRMWRVNEIRNEDGQGMAGAGPNARGDNDIFQNVLLVRTASIINLPTQQASLHSVIVMEEQATIGKTLTQLADYAAMRTIGGARPPRDTAADTILTLFEPETSAPRSLTSLDLGYLTGLYRAPATQRATQQVGQITRGIVRAGETQAEAQR